jgi:GNAT superfamily N-acetyltransferase
MNKITYRRLPLYQDYPIVCRPALPKDTPEVMDLTRTIWDGHDYLPQVWADWLVDTQGLLAVAECGGRVVGTGKLTRLSARDWWLEGLRVHPQYQGRGIASHLNDYLLGVWLRSGGGTVRLATSFIRLMVQHMCERSGFSKIGQFCAFVAPVVAEETSSFNPLQESEIPEALAHISHSQSLDWSAHLMDLGWQWTSLDQAHLAEAASQGRAWWWQGRGGLLVIWENREEQETIPGISLLACPVEEMATFLLDYRRLAWKNGYKQVIWNAPLHPDLLPVLSESGFQRDWDEAMYIYARQHPQQSDCAAARLVGHRTPSLQ